MAASSGVKAGAGGGVVVVHGGAWDIPKHLWKASMEGVKAAARRGHQVSVFVCYMSYIILHFFLHTIHTC